MSSQLFHWSFKLDGVFYKADQETVYNIVARDIINASLDGYSGWSVVFLLLSNIVLNCLCVCARACVFVCACIYLSIPYTFPCRK